MTNSRKVVVVLGVVAAGLVATGGSAFTNSADLPASKAGYSSAQVSGAVVRDVIYNTNATGDTILSVTLKLDGDMTGGLYNVKIGFNANALENVCTIGAFDGLTGPNGETTVDCDTANISTASVQNFRVLVTNS